MRKLLISAAAAALTGASAVSAATFDKPNYDAAFAPTSAAPSSSRSLKFKKATQGLTQRHALKPSVKLHSQSTLRNETDTRLGVSTFVWANSKSLATPLTPLKNDTRVETGARSFLNANSAAMGLSKAAVAGARVSGTHDVGKGPLITRFQQTFNGTDVFGRSINVMTDRNLRPVAASGYFAPQAKNQKSDAFSLDVEQALSYAVSDLGGSVSPGALGAKSATEAGYSSFKATHLKAGKLSLQGEQRGKKVYYPAGDSLVPAWYVEVLGNSADHGGDFGYSYVISAVNGKVLFRKNLTNYETFTYRTWADPASTVPYDSPLGSSFPNAPLPAGANQTYNPARTIVPSQLVQLDHGPISTGDSWLAAGAVETTGNNVDAYLDLGGPAGESVPGGFQADFGDFRAQATSANTFDYEAYQGGDVSPLTTAARNNAIVNLFYLNNWLHDFYYDAGFKETDGNAQTSNYGRYTDGKTPPAALGEGDPIIAQGQDYSGRNNANMRTPADGTSPTMQMYLFDGATTLGLDLTAPAPATSYDVGTASFGPTNFNVSADLVAALPANGCSALTNPAGTVTGKIVVIDRGVCSFQSKTVRAQTAGAIGVIIVNNAAGSAPGLGDDTTQPEPSIPTISVSQADGTTIKAKVTAGTTTGTMHIPTASDYDGTVDNGIIAHEFFHYVSNRLVSDGAGLNNQQGGGMGEGWSDVSALLLTVHEGDDALAGNEDFGGAYSEAAWATGSAYYGIRRLPYSTNFAINPLTFKHISEGTPLPVPTNAPVAFGANGVGNSEVHNVGEIWANTLWGFYVKLLNAHDFADAQLRMKQYVIAGLKMTPYSPTILEARDGILAAVKATDADDFTLAAQAFAERGMGVGAIGPDRNSTTLTGVTESNIALAQSFEVTDVSLDFNFSNGQVGYKDLDGILDPGETAQVTVSIQSNGTVDLTTPVTVALSTDGDVTFPGGNTVTFSAADADGNATATFLMTLNSATSTAQPVTLSLAFPQAGADADTVIEPSGVDLTFYTNYDIVRNAKDNDDVETFLASEADWTSTFLGGSGDQWGIVDGSDFFGSGLGWFIPDNATPSDVVLTSPVLTVGSDAPFTFSFDHYWEFEYAGTDAGVVYGFDGGIVEIKVGDGDWTDVVTAGGSFTQNGYNGRVLALDPENGVPGFVDFSTNDFVTSTISFGTTLAGKTVQLRFRAASDEAVGEYGWFIDNFTPTGVSVKTFSDIVAEGGADDAARALVPADFSTPERADATTTEQATIVLNGGSTVTEGTTYAWTQTAGPTVALSGADTPTASFKAPSVGEDTDLTFSLTVTNGETTSTADVTVTITNVQTPGTLTISAPAAISVGSPITLTANGSDPDGPYTYELVQTGGPTLNVANYSDVPTITLTPEKVGAYSFNIVGTDPEGSKTTAGVSFEVKPAVKQGGGAFGWSLVLGGLAAAGLRRRRKH